MYIRNIGRICSHFVDSQIVYCYYIFMKIFISVKTNSKKPGVEKIDDTHFIVRVKEPPMEGKANEAVLMAVADFLDIPPSSLVLVSGTKSKNKILTADY
jgi:uncharacterized protein